MKNIALAAVALHNLLCERAKDNYSLPEFLDREDTNNGMLMQGQMRQHVNASLECLQPVGRGHTSYAKEVQETLKDYFINEEVSWQARMALLH